MSAALAVDDVIQVTLSYTQDAQQLLMVLHYRVSVAGTGADAESQLDTIANWFSVSTTAGRLAKVVKDALSEDVFLQSVRAQKVKPFRTIYSQVAIADTGAIAEPAAPVNSAFSIEKQSLKVGRKGVGRVQLAGLPKTAVDSQIDGAYITGAAADFIDFLTTAQVVTTLGTLALKPCLPAGGTDHDYDLWDAIPQTTTRTMHRRTLGLGI